MTRTPDGVASDDERRRRPGEPDARELVAVYSVQLKLVESYASPPSS